MSQILSYAVRLSLPPPETQLGTSNATGLQARVDGAIDFGADLFLSIHTNASLDSSASGSEALVYAVNSTAEKSMSGSPMSIEMATTSNGFG